MRHIIFHIDVNSAYLSWTAIEYLKRGEEDLRGIPCIIGGDKKSRHGVVLAKSIPAKAYGVRTGEPVVSAFRKCPMLRLEPPDHKMYARYSKRLMELLKSYTPDIEQLSIDECFLDFTGIAHRFSTPVDAAFEIKNRIREELGFTVNIGISTNKLLAKMASDFQKPDRVHTLFPEEIRDKMWPLDISELYMAGRASVEVLRKLEIRTIGELARSDPDYLEIHLKSHGRLLWEFANGRGDDIVKAVGEEAKGIGNSTTLSEDAKTEEEAKKVLLMLAQSVGRRLRKAGKKAGSITVEIRYATFRNVSHQMQVTPSAQSDTILYQRACELFGELWDGTPIRLLGIRASRLEEESAPQQMNLFDYLEEVRETKNERKQDQKHRKLDRALDEIRKKFVDDAVMRAAFLKKQEKKEEKDPQDQG